MFRFLFIISFLLLSVFSVYAACGDGVCDATETFATCAIDCDTCGNGSCGYNETVTSCPADCVYCGNGVCETGETSTSCSIDCSVPAPNGSGGTGKEIKTGTSLDAYSFTGGGKTLNRSSFTSPLAVSSDTSDLTPISGGSGSGTLGTGVGSLGGSGSLGSGVGTIGNSSVLGNFNIGSSVGLGSGVGSVQASNQSAYTNADYSAVCDCKQVFNDFITSVKGSSLFSAISFSNLSTGSSGDSAASIPTSKFGNLSFDLAKYAGVYSYVAALLMLLASVISVRIIAIKR